MYRETKAAKPWVKVGISPFGIWRPGHPPGIAGFDSYAGLYADSRLWLREGWVDYLAPQLYWPIAREKQSYPKLLNWWLEQNPKGRHVWPGLFTSRYPAEEIVAQVKLTRETRGAQPYSADPRNCLWRTVRRRRARHDCARPAWRDKAPDQRA